MELWTVLVDARIKITAGQFFSWTRNGTCKTPDEIRNFLEDNPLYLIAQQNDYAGEIFAGADPKILEKTLKDASG